MTIFFFSLRLLLLKVVIKINQIPVVYRALLGPPFSFSSKESAVLRRHVAYGRS